MRSSIAAAWIAALTVAASIEAGPNTGAGIAIDFVPATAAIDSVDTVSGNTVTVYVTAVDAVNLDTYSFDLTFDPAVLEYMVGVEDNVLGGVTNFLKTEGGTTVGFQCVFKKDSTNVLTVANTLVHSDSAKAPEGTGVLAIVQFRVLSSERTELILSNALFGDHTLVYDEPGACHRGVLVPYSTAARTFVARGAPDRSLQKLCFVSGQGLARGPHTAVNGRRTRGSPSLVSLAMEIRR